LYVTQTFGVANLAFLFSSAADVKDTEQHQLERRSALSSTTGISVLDRLIRTCPVWLQLCMTQEQAVDILKEEAAGIFLVNRDTEMKCMVLLVHFTVYKEESDVLRYNIKEEKSMMYLEGSVLVFEDIFKLVAFYCVSRDILPSTLKLPQSISLARSVKDLDDISNLGTGFWESSMKHKRGLWVSHSKEFSANGKMQTAKLSQHISSKENDCTCEIEMSVGNDRMWFVNPIFVEECRNTETADELPVANCAEKPVTEATKIVYRRPPPPPPLHHPPLPSVPPSAPPPNYVRSPFHSPPPGPSLPPPPPDPPLSPVNTSQAQLQVTQDETLSPSSSSDTLMTSVSDSSPPQDSCVPPSSHPPSLPCLQQTSGTLKDLSDIPTITCLDAQLVGQTCQEMKINSLEEKKEDEADVCSGVAQTHKDVQTTNSIGFPPVVPRRRQSGKPSEKKANSLGRKDELHKKEKPSPPGINTSVKSQSHAKPEAHLKNEETTSLQKELEESTIKKRKPPPVPPPRIKKHSNKSASAYSVHGNPAAKEVSTEQRYSVPIIPQPHSSTNQTPASKTKELKDSDKSMNSKLDQDPTAEQDTYSTSSNEDELEKISRPSIKKTQSFMLSKNRLSIVAITNVFTAFMSNDRKMQKKITELAQDKDSYFGNLVQDYKTYSLEMMAKQSSSTEMLQEIRLMMTQLKSYLVQSTEIKSMVEYELYTDEKLEAIIEAALCKCVLKPLKSPIESYLREIHTKDGSLRLLTENQLVIQDTTTTDLGITTSVPESNVMEKITHKFGTMHKTYSPEKKIAYLLKACKLIYDSMAAGNPGKPHGADDFLPVLMYVLARCHLEELLLDVEYMMELMDPALQLGEGSYYLTTTYGALEHVKNYDKITVTRQLSVEVQDSIHRWERRRTLNKARVSRSSIQDFITISFEELDSRTRTLVSKPDTSVALVLQQCAEKFEVSEPQKYGLFVMVEDRTLRLDENAFPHQVKSNLLKNEQKVDFHFLYKQTSSEDVVVKDTDFL
ncbi:ras and Rab interactor 3, partial [Bombina bombina]|uniref:ras and Rab interactor 3 n=1 Tax=Bombina bombina TaxID=8345 RepID=UPI00235B23D3